MSLAYTTITGHFIGGDEQPLSGTVIFTASQAVYAAGIPVITPDVPVAGRITDGVLLSESGGALQLLATDNAGLTFLTLSGFFYWSVQVTAGGVTEPAWSFGLPSSPGTRDLFSLANMPFSGGGVASVTAADASVVIAGTGTAPTVRTGTLDVIAAQHPPAANWSNSGKKITSVANGSSASDVAAFGQIPAALPPNGAAGGVLSGSYPNPGYASTPLPESGGTMAGWIAPKVVTLTDAAPVTVNAALGNDYRLLTTSGMGASRTVSAPTSAVDGQAITVDVQQAASGGPYTVTWASGAGGYSFGTDGAPALSTSASAVDTIGFRYHGGLGKWLCCGWKLGFS